MHGACLVTNKKKAIVSSRISLKLTCLSGLACLLDRAIWSCVYVARATERDPQYEAGSGQERG